MPFRKALPTVAAALPSIAALPAHATAFCNVPRTQDGLVARRAGPSPDTRLITRMRLGDVGFALDRRGCMHQRFVGEDCG
jgi:hypothetical protein